jgi:hypothetical protein
MNLTPPLPARKPLDIATYWNTVGTDNIEKIIASIGSSIQYFRMVKIGRKGISPGRAEQIIAAARVHTPGFEPDFELMVRPRPPHKASVTKGRKIQPSAEFLAAQEAS